MSVLSTLIVRLGVDAGGFREELEKGAEQAGKFGESVQNLGKIALGVAGVGLAALGGAIAMLGPKMIDAASDMNESVSKANVVFGSAISTVDAFAASSATSFGIAKQAAYEATGTFGNLFTTIGLSKGSAADMSVDIVKLASDLASFNNLDTAEVLDKLRSGLVGETEPLRSLGVNINEAAVQAKAQQMGLTKTTASTAAVAKAQKDLNGIQSAANDILKMYGPNSEQYQKALQTTAGYQKKLSAAQAGGTAPLTDAMKLQARYALILEQTTTAQGDFARTSDGLANTQRILSATFKDISADVGTAFLPAVLGIAQAVQPLVKSLMPGLQSALKAIAPVATDIGNSIGIFVEVLTRTGDPIAAVRGALDNFPDLRPTFDGMVASVQSFIATIQPTVDQVTSWISQNISLQDVLTALGIAVASFVIPAIISMVAAAAPIVAAFLILVGVAALLRQAWENDWGGIQEKTAAVWAWLQPIIANLVAWLQARIPEAIRTLTSWFNTLSNWFNTNLPMIRAIWETVWTVIGDVVQSVISVFTSTILPNIQGALNSFSAAFQKTGIDWGSVWDAIKVALEVAAIAIGAILLVVVGIIVGVVNGIAAAAQAFADGWAGIWSGITQIVAGFATWFAGISMVIQGIVAGNWTQVWEGVKLMFKGVFDTIVGLLTTLVTVFQTNLEMIGGFVSGFVEGVVTFFTDLYNRLVGQSIIPDLVRDIQKFFQRVIDFVHNNVIRAFEDLVSHLKGAFKAGLEWVRTNVLGPFVNTLNDIIGIIQGVISKINELAAKLRGQAVQQGLGAASPTAYALGGSAMAGVPILVGDRGPEVFIPATSGYIVPHGAWQPAPAAAAAGRGDVNLYGDVVVYGHERTVLEELQALVV